MVILLCVDEVKGERIDDFTGLAQRSPMAAAAMLIFLLSLAGVPPTAGFVGSSISSGQPSSAAMSGSR